MPEQERTTFQGDRGSRMLNLDAIMLHNNHLQGGRRKTKRCSVCAQGLAGVMEGPPQGSAVDEKPKVAEGDGTDQTGNPALPSDRGTDTRGEADKLLGFFIGDKEVS